MKDLPASILVVDDSRLIRKMLTTTLEQEGFSVSSAEDGEMALELLGKKPFELILLDIVMPGISGIEVLRKIRKKHTVSELPIIMVTAENETQAIVKALGLGANDYITKPVDIPVVLARIKTQLTLKRSEEALKQYSTELEQSNKLKDLFIDIMGHDLLKPADIARLSTELLMDMEESVEKKDILENILESQIRIIDLIENASVLAKLESGKKLEFKSGDLLDALSAASDDMSDLSKEKNIEIEIEASGRYPAMINPLIYDVFSNLLGNAIKYSPPDSKVWVSISNDLSNWRVCIKDDGKGIPDEHKESVFDRFKRLEKGGVRGTGLGLAIAKRVVEAHGGRIWIEDNIKGGSIFCVEIPKA